MVESSFVRGCAFQIPHTRVGCTYDAGRVKDIMETFLTLDITWQDEFMKELGQEDSMNLPRWIEIQHRLQSLRTSEDEEPSPHPITIRKRRSKRRPLGSRRSKRTGDDLFLFVREERGGKRWFPRPSLCFFGFQRLCL